MKLNHKWEQLVLEVEEQIREVVSGIEHTAEINQWKIMEAFRKHRVSDYHFQGSTGYGYNDRGREVLDEVYKDIFKAESAFVRPHFVSGTHTIATALFGMLRPGDELLYITGKPYDTLHKVIGSAGDGTGSLQDYGITYRDVDLLPDGKVDWDQVLPAIHDKTKVIGIQRSRGYAWRPSFSVDEIGEMVERIKRVREDLIVFVDNCYGEFTEVKEPTEVGVDLVAGSLIKNPGGSLAPMGGYIAGKEPWVTKAAYRLTAPGIGGEVGATLGTMRSLYQGLFLAPHFVGQALRGSVFAAAFFERMGVKTDPKWNDARTDLIQAFQFSSSEDLIRFVQSVQHSSPVDAHVTPEPWDMPGYDHPVIMAAGTFIQGGSLELSADAPIREPFTAFMQGGLTYAHVKQAVLEAYRTIFEHKNCNET